MRASYDDRDLIPGQESLGRLNAALQHEEEVQQQIEQGNMAPHEVALYLLSHGSTGQKISMLEHLPRTLKEVDDKRIAQVISELNDAMWNQDIELQCAAPPALVSILPQLCEANILLLLSGAKKMLEVRTQDIRKAWNQLVLEIVGFLPQGVIVKEIVPIVLKKSEHSEPNDQRVLTCELIGRICRRLDPQAIMETIFNKAISMCRDTDMSIRAAMCEQLGEVSRAVGLETTKAKITQEIFELLVDDEKYVSRAAFTCLIDLVEFFDPPYRREHFYPIIKEYIHTPPEEVLSLLIEEFGRFLWKIRSDIQCSEDVTLFANFFRQCAQKPDPDVRRMCAFNLPAVVASLPIATYPTHITHTTRALAVDSHPTVRRSVAAGLHELFPLLGDRASFYLKEPFMAVIQDETVEVRALIIQQLTDMLNIFAANLKGDERDVFFNAVVTALVNYEADVQKDWRKVAVLLNHLEAFPNYVPGQTIFDKLLPLLVRHLQYGANAVKEQCAHLIIYFSRKIGNNNLVVDVFSKTVIEIFGRSTSCYNRLAYITLFRMSVKYYSRSFLRDRMLELILGMSEDAVPVVKVNLVRILPDVRRLLKSPVEEEHQKSYQKAIQKLQSDTSPDVIVALKQAVLEIDEIEKDYARQAALRLPNAPDDVEDKQREESEGNLLELAREQEKNERRQKIREMLRNEREANQHMKPGPKRSSHPGPGRVPVGPARTTHGPVKVVPKVSSRR